ncbi:MAG: metal-dependent hydrolase [Bacillota bacterium]|nr:metal-dependent hydrolase [Bacillota bacterium]MDP4154797.1 metal-dependent hydrolase [Bacillota bacterium]
MDTFSHIVIGMGVGGLALIDPAVSNDPTLSQAVFVGAVIGSNAPDFDFVYRLKSRGSYIRHHRGFSHSLPALPLWGIIVPGVIYPFFSGINFFHLFIWSFLAVILHVLFDLFNVDGTQILLPFSRKWIAFDAIPLIDPYILLLHFLGFALFPFFHSGETFLVIYVFIFLYIALRTISTVVIKKYLQIYFLNALQIKLIPRMVLFKWDTIIETEEDFIFGVYSKNSLKVEHTLSKKIDFPELVKVSRNDHAVSDFLSATQFAYPFVHKYKSGYYIYWKDLRFRTKKFFPFRAILFISSDLKNKKSYVGWFNSLKKYKKVLKNLKKSHTSI